MLVCFSSKAYGDSTFSFFSKQTSFGICVTNGQGSYVSRKGKWAGNGDKSTYFDGSIRLYEPFASAIQCILVKKCI